MTINLFGTDGIRGVAGEFPLDEVSLIRLGQAIAALAPNPRIVIGRDTRSSGAAIEKHLCRGLGNQARIFSCGVVPTPGLAFLTRKTACQFGIMISASHNPYRDNGIKIFNARGEKISNLLEKQISARLQAAMKAVAGRPEIHALDTMAEYSGFLQDQARHHTTHQARIVMDCANGAASRFAPPLFKNLGFDVRVTHARPNGKNINAGCGSTCPQTLKNLVLQEKADWGMAFDGDADRVIFADPDGQTLTGDHVLYVLAQYLQIREPAFHDRVVGTVMANLGLEKALAAKGIAFSRSAVGDKHVYSLMKKNHAILGGEPSGHIILRHLQTTGDGLLTGIVFLQALDFFKWSGRDVRRQLFLFPQRVVNVAVRHKKNLQRWPALVEAQQEFQKKNSSQARLLIRYSGTEPLLRIMMEAGDMEIIERQLPRFVTLIKNEIGV